MFGTLVMFVSLKDGVAGRAVAQALQVIEKADIPVQGLTVEVGLQKDTVEGK